MDMVVQADSKQQANYMTIEASAVSDLAWEILQLLPVKSLLRFKCVSKSWKALISNGKFIFIHLNRYNKTKERFFVHLLCGAKVIYGTTVLSLGQIMANKLICSNEFSVVEFLDADSEMHPMFFKIRFLCHCNGVLCLSEGFMDASNSEVFLFNPSTKESLTLPGSCLPFIGDRRLQVVVTALGFGCDLKSNDYKVVRVVRYYLGEEENSPFYERVEVYTLGTDSWREIGPVASFPFYSLYIDGPSKAHYSSIYLNGACHWYWSEMDQIISFNLGAEEFKILPISTILPETRFLSCLLVLNGCLALFSRDSEIWVMKEYGVKESWTKMFTIESLVVEEPLLFWSNDGEIVLFTRSAAKDENHRRIPGEKLLDLVSYNLRTQEIKPFDDYRVKEICLYGGPKAFAFMDSLVSLKKEVIDPNQILEQKESS